MNRDAYLDKTALDGKMEATDELVWLTISTTGPTEWLDVVSYYFDTEYKYYSDLPTLVDMILKLNFKIIYRDYLNAYTGEYDETLYETETVDTELADGTKATHAIKKLREPDSFESLKANYTDLYKFASTYVPSIGIYIPSNYIRKDLLRAEAAFKASEQVPKSDNSSKEFDLSDIFKFCCKKRNIYLAELRSESRYKDQPDEQLYPVFIVRFVDDLMASLSLDCNQILRATGHLAKRETYKKYKEEYESKEKINPVAPEAFFSWISGEADKRLKSSTQSPAELKISNPAGGISVEETNAETDKRKQIFSHVLEGADDGISFDYTNPHMLKVQEDSLAESKQIVERGKIYFQRTDIRLYHYPLATRRSSIEYYVDELVSINWHVGVQVAATFSAQLVVSDDIQQTFNIGDSVMLQVKGKTVFWGIIKSTTLSQRTSSFNLNIDGLDIYHTIFMSETVMSGVSMLKNTESDNTEDQERRFVLSKASSNLNPASKPLDAELIKRFAFADTMFFNSNHEFVVPQVLTDFIDRVLIFPRRYNGHDGPLETSKLLYKDTDTNLLVRSYYSESFARFGCSCYGYIRKLSPAPFIEMWADIYNPLENVGGESKTQRDLIDSILKRYGKTSFVHPDDPIMQPYEAKTITDESGSKTISAGTHKAAKHTPTAPLHIITRIAPLTNAELLNLPHVTVHNSLINSISLSSNASEVYSAFQVIPDVGVGSNPMEQHIFMPPVIIPELAEMFGLRLLTVQSPYNTLQPGLVQPASFYWAYRDLQRLIRGVAFNPFLESGTITIPAHDNVRAGMALHIVSNFRDSDPYVAYITSVDQSRSPRLESCTTKISFIRGCTYSGHNNIDCAFEFEFKTQVNDKNSILDSVKFDAETLSAFIDKTYTYHTKFHNLHVKTGKYDI